MQRDCIPDPFGKEIEMEEKGMKDCTFEGKTYSHGEEVCIADKCMRCNDGNWDITEVRESGAED